MLHIVDRSYNRCFTISKARLKATIVVLNYFNHLSMLRLLPSTALHSDHFNVRRRHGLPSSFVRQQSHLSLRDTVDGEYVGDDSDALVQTSPECSPPILWV